MSYIRLQLFSTCAVQSIVLKCCVIIRTSRKREAMSIIYSLVSRGTTVLVDYTETTGNFQQITGSILQKIPLHNDTKCTYVSGRLVKYERDLRETGCADHSCLFSGLILDEKT